MTGDGRIERISGDRWSVIVELIRPDFDDVLDVGCRDRALSARLPQGCRYVGMDIFPPADVIASAEDPLPFAANSFSCVVFADVLEHLNDPHSAVDEAFRVARRSVVVLLPNMFSLIYRLQFMRGRMSASKYGFGAENPADRHRWIMSFQQAADFTRGRAERAGWQVVQECAHDGDFRRWSARLGYGAARRLGTPNLWAWQYAARIEPQAG